MDQVKDRVEVRSPFPRDQLTKYYQWFWGDPGLTQGWSLWDFLRECPFKWDSGKHWGVWVGGELRGVIHVGATGELSCALDPSAQGRGVARDAVSQVLREWSDVWARTDNPAAARGLRLLGFTKDSQGIYRRRPEGDNQNE